jgi:hypothetical protein
VLPTTFSEAIGLYLRQPGSENEYLYPQIFAGIMYIAAATCMWLLRAWKVGDNDRKELQKLQGWDLSKPEEFAERQAIKPKVMDRWRSGRVSVWWRYGVV